MGLELGEHLMSRRCTEHQVLPDSPTQEWLYERLNGLTPADFHKDRIAICMPPHLSPPLALQDVWHTIGDTSLLLNGALVAVMLIFCDPMDTKQMQLCTRFVQTLSKQSQLVILVAHSVAPHLQTQASEEDAHVLAISQALKAGVDDVIMGEHTGMALVAALRAKVAVHANLACKVEHSLAEREHMLHCLEDLREIHHDAIWDYLRQRLCIQLPWVDTRVAPGEPCEIGGFKVGANIGRGAFGKVFKLDHSGPDCAHASKGEVVKTIPKDGIQTTSQLRSLGSHISLMTLLSSEPWAHPNLVKLHQVYHTKTHICFRMEDAGPMNLNARLYEREESDLALSTSKANSIITQCITALSHLHLGPKIAHRDIKPENIIVSEEASSVRIKLADFDMATNINDDLERPTELRGTFPFFAPEMVLARNAKVLPTDVWSMGMVVLEVMCSLNCIMHILQLSDMMEGTTQATVNMMKSIHSYFLHPHAVPSFLGRRIQPELKDLMGVSEMFLLGMLQVLPDQRWTAKQLLEALPLLSEGLPSTLVGSAGALKKLRSFEEVSAHGKFQDVRDGVTDVAHSGKSTPDVQATLTPTPPPEPRKFPPTRRPFPTGNRPTSNAHL